MPLQQFAVSAYLLVLILMFCLFLSLLFEKHFTIICFLKLKDLGWGMDIELVICCIILPVVIVHEVGCNPDRFLRSHMSKNEPRKWNSYDNYLVILIYCWLCFKVVNELMFAVIKLRKFSSRSMVQRVNLFASNMLVISQFSAMFISPLIELADMACCFGRK